MTEREDPIRRRQNSAPRRRETIEELYGDILAPKPIGLFDEDEPAPGAPPHRDAAFSELAADGPEPPHSAYHSAAEGAPGSFKRSGRLDFPRNGGDLTAVVLGHGLVTLCTLGIWRFWQVTAQRRSIWAHTKLAGEPFEYRGAGIEMFIGAAIVAVVLGALMLASQMALGWLGLSAPLGLEYDLPLAGLPLTLASLALVPPLIEYARFRARRYRLRRTRWRGIRFDMRGGGLGLVLRWALWTPVVIATLGLAWPFLSAARERYMTNRSFWGDEPFFFRGSAWRLMPHWALLWLMLALPSAFGAAHVWQAVERAGQTPAPETAAAVAPTPETAAADAPTPDAPAPETAPAADPAPLGAPAPFERIRPQDPAPQTLEGAEHVAARLIPLRDGLIAAGAPLIAAGPATQWLIMFAWSALIVLCWFGFRAARLRMFMNARRIAGARARCKFRSGALVQAWLATLGRSIWPGILVYALITAVVVILLASIDLKGPAPSDAMELLFGQGTDWRSRGLMIMALAINYGSVALFGMWLTEVVWFRAFFHHLCAATQIEGLETLEHIRQRPQAAAAEAEGFADAFDVDAAF